MPTSYSAATPDSAKRHGAANSSESRVEMTNHQGEAAAVQEGMDVVLPPVMLLEIFSRIPDARDLARCAAVNVAFRRCFNNTTVVHLRCRLIRPREQATPFKDIVTGTLKQMTSVATLRLEIEEGFADPRFKDDEIERKRIWLCEKSFMQKWIPQVQGTLQNLTVIDFGMQAIFHATSLLQLLAAHCKQLRKLELRNMYLDCRDVEKMHKVKSVSLRCVKLHDTGLRDIVNCMPQLEILMLATVVGLQEAVFESDSLKELCLGLATTVKAVSLTARRLQKLQLKLAGAGQLTVRAPNLRFLAVSVDKSEKTAVQFENVKLLTELLVGATEFKTLRSLTSANALLDKMFLDVPCMGFEDNGGWKGVMMNVALPVPDMEAIRSSCPHLITLSVGPGLWYALEENIPEQGPSVPKWPMVKRLIVHMIVQNLAKSMGLLSDFVSTIPTLLTLEIYIHTESDAQAEDFLQLGPQFPQVKLTCGTWKRGLRFDCFSF